MMMKYGKKIIAILTTAVCLIGVLPLFASAKIETIYVPPVMALTLNTRFSNSQGVYVDATGSRDALTIPLPLDKINDVIIGFGERIAIGNEAFYLDSDYTLLRVQYDIYEADGRTDTVTLESQYFTNASYVVINIFQSSNWDEALTINDKAVTVLQGSYTIAQPERYEQIEVPDDTEPSDDVDIAGNVLTLWHRILSDNVDSLCELYELLTKPIALIIGIPLCIAIISIIFTMLGGKKR